MGKVEPLAGMKHRVGERCSFRTRQPLEQRGHEPRGYLVVRNLPRRVAADEKFDFWPRKLAAVAFLANHVNGAESAVAGGIGGDSHYKRKPPGRRVGTGRS